MSIVLGAIEGIGKLLKFALKTYATVQVFFTVVVGLVFAAACFYIAGGGSTTRTVLAIGWGMFAASLMGLVLATVISVSRTLKTVVNDAGLGRRLFTLFDQIGVTEDAISNNRLLGAIFGLKPEELGDQLNNAADDERG